MSPAVEVSRLSCENQKQISTHMPGWARLAISATIMYKTRRPAKWTTDAVSTMIEYIRAAQTESTKIIIPLQRWRQPSIMDVEVSEAAFSPVSWAVDGAAGPALATTSGMSPVSR